MALATELAKLIEVEREAGEFSLRVDGKDFPWHIAVDGVTVHVSTDDLSSVTVTIVAEEVRVLDRTRPTG